MTTTSLYIIETLKIKCLVDNYTNNLIDGHMFGIFIVKLNYKKKYLSKYSSYAGSFTLAVNQSVSGSVNLFYIYKK